MVRPVHPSNLELQALTVLWHEGPSPVSAIHQAMPDQRKRAYTTILSVMQNLERKKLVKRSRSGRAHVYAAAITREVIIRQAARHFLTNAFGGRLGEALLALISNGTLTPEEKTSIQRELQRHKTMAAKKAAKKTAVKTATKAVKKAAKKAPAKSAPAKKAAVKKVAKKAAKKAVKKAAKKAPAKKAVAKKAAKKASKKAAKKA